MKVFDWQPEPSEAKTLSVIFADNDLWFSHKTLSNLFNVTKQNISLYVKDIAITGLPTTERDFAIEQIEGKRTIRRQIKHFPFQIAHVIALRSQRFDELSRLVDLATKKSVLRPIYRVVPVKEREFATLLIGALEGIETVISQFSVGPYFVDFYLMQSNIVIEYDENHHGRPKHREQDRLRQKFIEEKLKAEFIRIKHGMEIQGLNEVLRSLFLGSQRT